MRIRISRLAGLGAAALLAAGCTGGVDLDTEPSGPVPPAPAIATTHAPDDAPVLLASQDATTMALQVSERYFASAHVVVMAPARDEAAIARASSIAMAAGVPLLLTGAPGGGFAVENELVRLSTHSAITVGAVDVDEFDVTGLDLVPDPQNDEDLTEILGVDITTAEFDPEEPEEPEESEETDEEEVSLGEGTEEPEAAEDDGSEGGHDEQAPAETAGGEENDDAPAQDRNEPGQEGDDEAGPVAEPDYLAELMQTQPGEVLEIEPDTPGTTDEVGQINPTEPAERLQGQLVLADGDPAQVAAVGIARAAGADVIVTDQISTDSSVIDAVSGAESVLGLGTAFGPGAEFDWRVLTAATGTQLPGGGQEVFGGKRYIALYGHPESAAMGVLGEQGTEETIALAQEHADPYTELTDDEVIPALEIIVTVATRSAGSDGSYSYAWPPETFEPLVEAAADAGQYVTLDFQPGRNTFLEQIEEYEDLLAYPHVGVALDPEWRLLPDQEHLEQIGHVRIEEVNEVVTYLADFVRENDLPQKMLVVHQFQDQMIRDRDELKTSRPELALVIHADGQGSQDDKSDTWDMVLENPPGDVAWGWKNFIDEDDPMLTPEETYEIEPLPEFVSYQ